MHALQATVLTLKQSVNSVNSQPPVGCTLLGVRQLPPLQSIFLTQDSSKHRVLCKLPEIFVTFQLRCLVLMSARERQRLQRANNFLGEGQVVGMMINPGHRVGEEH